MSQDSEKYLHFHVALLKDSFAMDALRQDALKYHMIDHPGQLIALRLTEYYEIMARGLVPPVASVSIATSAAARKSSQGAQGSGLAADTNGGDKEGMTTTSSVEGNEAASATEQLDDQNTDGDRMVAASPDAEQNAEEAADYWTLL
ncbi:MAG TPA: hypothetical protein VKR06_29700 [Ktedonosporobacter sp.]|nr:hypothetical protein [Ktedonosporobacter sp.]